MGQQTLITVFLRLSIASAHAFLLVYSVTDPTSFSSVKSRLEEIKEQRSDFQVILCTIIDSLAKSGHGKVCPYWPHRRS
jgi:GTPase SAR1 family protein